VHIRGPHLLNGVAEHALHADAPRAGEVIPLRAGTKRAAGGGPNDEEPDESGVRSAA
jgi:hypothetical protein